MKNTLKYGIAILITLLTSSCIKRENFKASYPVYGCKGLYSNVYSISWAGIFNDPSAQSIYLTDSATFRIYLGVFGENEGFECRISGDRLYYTKKASGYAFAPIVVEKKVFKLSELKKKNKFDSR